MPKLEDLELYMNDNDVIFGYDKDRKEYVLDVKGEIKPVPEGSIDPMWGGCSLEYAKKIQEERNNA